MQSALAIALMLVFLAAFVGVFAVHPARGYAPQPAGTQPIEPNPALEGNVTFATHNLGWAALQYPGTGGVAQNISATPDPRVTNPTVVIPTDVIAPGVLQGEKLSGSYWNSTTFIAKSGATPNGGAVLSNTAVVTVNGQPAVTCAMNESTHGGGTTQVVCAGSVTAATWPSQNVQFNYLTMGITLSGAACGTCYAYASLSAASTSWVFDRYASNGTIKPIVATSVAQAQVGSVPVGGQMFMSIPFNLLGAAFLPSAGNTLSIQVGESLPQGSAGTFTVTITQLAFTTGPMAFGVTTWAKNPVTLGIGQTYNLSAFGPTFTWTTIAAGGYTVAVLQSANYLTNATTTPSTVNLPNATSGGVPYVEQITYSFPYQFPTAAALTYGSFKLIDRVNISGAQYSSVSFGGTSYTAAYNGYVTCTAGVCTGVGTYQTVQSSVTPTTAQSWIGIVVYTGPQWDSMSAPPGIFSTNGLQYWWFVLVGAIIAIAGGSSAWVTRSQRNLRIRRGVGRAPFLWLVDLEERRAERRLGRNCRGLMRPHHLMAISLGLIVAGAGGIALWSIFNGADTVGALGSFTAGLLLLLMVAAIAFVVYEIHERMEHRRHRG